MKVVAKIILFLLKNIICNRPYDELIDVDYMERWHLKRTKTEEGHLYINSDDIHNIYFHRFIGSDGPVMHDHPWWSISFILSNSYTEHTPEGSFKRKAGDIIYRSAHSLHWIEIEDPVYTLFITGPKIKEWGFMCSKVWFHWKDYMQMRGPNRQANGCGEY